MIIENGVLEAVKNEDIVDGEFIIPEGVTSIGNGAFEDCSSLTKIDLPAGVTSIGEYAFRGCSSLTEMNLPAGLTSIGSGAFFRCSSLTKIDLPAGVTSIERNAFYYCSSLTKIDLPAGLTSIESGAFEYCSSLTEINLPAGVTSIERNAFEGCSSLKGINLPEGLTSIEKYAFRDCSSLTKIDLPAGVTSIERNAFEGCSSLTEINLPAGLTSIEGGAFEDCSSLKGINLPAGVTSIKWGAFEGCSSLTEINLPAGVTSIGTYAFKGCNSLKEIDIPEGVTSIGGYAFRGCSSLTEINLPAGLTSIESGAFENCSSLTEINLPAGVTRIESGAFYGCSGLTEINLPAGVTSIEDEAFRRCSSLKGINLPAGVTRIESGAFYGCSGLTEINLPAGVTSIEKNAFEGCSSLTEINLPDGITSIEYNAFSGCNNLTEINLPEGITRIERNAFKGCSSLTEINLPEGLTSIDYYALSGCNSLTSIEIPGSMLNKKSISELVPNCQNLLNIKISGNITEIGEGTFRGCSNLKSIELPAGVTSIESGAFSGYSSLTKIDLQEGITRIERNAFSGCSSLTEINLPAGVTSIEDEAFRGCSSLKGINLPEGITSIEKYAFRDCSSLTKIDLPSGLTSIGSGAFFRCSSLKKIDLPAGLTSIESGAFEDCSSLKGINLLEGITSIEKYAFRDCSSLTEINLPAGVTSIKDEAFRGCSSLTEINLPAGVTSIKSNAFEGCSSLKGINLPEGLTSIEKHAFRDCSSLTKIDIPEGVTSIGGYAFRGCSSLTEINLPAGLTSIGSGAFFRCSSLKKIDLPAGVTSIKSNAFEGCSSLTEINLPDGITSIEYNAFSGCNNLTEINLPEGITSIERNAFSGCSSLTEINLPAGVTSIESNAFEGCSSLTEINLPAGVTRIESGAFYGCSGLTEINLPAGVTSIEDEAFRGCSSLTEINLPAGVTSIEDEAFRGCSSLKGINLPAGVTSIERGAFSDCSGLTSIKIPNNVIEIGVDAFKDCKGLTNVEIEEGVEAIYYGVFTNCNSLTSINIPDSITVIGVIAFTGCDNLKEINIRGITIEYPKDKEQIDIAENKVITVIGLKNNNGNFENKIKVNQEELIKEGYIAEDLSQEEKDIESEKIKEKIENIFNICKFSQSTNYHLGPGNKYIMKLISVLGIDETEKMLKIPEHVTEEDIQRDSESMLEIYEARYNTKGEVPIVITLLQNIDTYLAEGNLDRKGFYIKLNEEIGKGQEKDIIKVLQKCASEAGINLNENQLQKMQKEIQTKQVTEKKEEIIQKIKEKTSNPNLNIEHRGISSSVIYNAIRANILAGGTYETIGKTINEELNRKKENGELYYGANIINQEEKLKVIAEGIYKENEELLNTNLVDILKGTKEKIGQGWIRKILASKNGIKDIWNLTEEEKAKLEEKLKTNGINLGIVAEKKYQIKEGIKEEEAYKKLDANHVEGLLTYEKAEIMFSEMKEPYSKEFKNWFIKNKEEIMSNSKYYGKIAILHNEFDQILENPRTKTLYKQGKLTIEGAIKIVEDKKSKVKPGNEELGKEATNVNATQEEVEEMEEIFEVTKKREKSYIPQAKSEGKRYRGRILRVDDPMNILAGNATNCCQKVGGLGEGSMRHGSMANNGRIFIVEELDETGKVIGYVAQSWVWRNKDTVCFDNIEVPLSEQPKLRYKTGDIEAQEEILKIYQECAKNMLETDEKMLKHLLEKGKITQKMYEELVLKQVTVGTGYNDLGVLKKHLDVVTEAEMVLPREEDISEYNPWVDSGKDSVTGEGAQLYLAKSDKKRVKGTHNLEEMPLLYINERETRKEKGRNIDEGIVRDIREIENKVYRNKQKILQNCEDYVDIAKEYEMDSDNIQVEISREKDWYIIYEEREEEGYIADIAMLNGANAEGKGEQKSDIIHQTLEMTESLYTMMINMANKRKKVRFEATEDTSYKNIMKMVEKGLVTIEQDEEEQWQRQYDDEYYDDEYDDEYYDKKEIMMHNMVVKVNKEKLEEELKRIKTILKKRQERRTFDKVDDEER